MRIGIDLMGGDSPPSVLFDGVLRAAAQLDASSTLTVIATHSEVADLRKNPELKLLPSNSAKIDFHPVSDAISMAEDPMSAIARKTESSIVVGIRMLKKKQLDAFVSAGNTGALVASATIQLAKLPGIKRPALLVSLPTMTGPVAILDVGGNIQCKASHLVQFALMGAAYQTCITGIGHPEVGLLNIGIEPKKGTSTVREAYQQLSQMHKDHFHFCGNIEGRDIFQGKVNVVVTDGFSGNVFLKTAEGVSSFIFDFIQDSLHASPSVYDSLRQLRKQFSYAEYPGAFVCGVEGIVIKCHGASSALAITNGIKGACSLVKGNVVAKIKDALQHVPESVGEEKLPAETSWKQLGFFNE